MAGRDVVDAFNNFVAPMNETLGCMTSGRLGIKGRLNGRIGRPSSVIFNRGNSLALARNDLEPIHFGAMHRFRCIEVADDERGLVKIETIEYWHSFDVFRGNVLRELFSFHWTPELLEGEGINEPQLHLKTPMPRSPTRHSGSSTSRPVESHSSRSFALRSSISMSSLEPLTGTRLSSGTSRRSPRIALGDRIKFELCSSTQVWASAQG